MTNPQVIPGLTTTDRSAVPVFIDDLKRSDIRTIALFPTAVDTAFRAEIYRELESIDGLQIPHVHLRTDCDVNEIAYLERTFGTGAFNVHPSANRHAYGPIPDAYRTRFFVENVLEPPSEEDINGAGGVCPDYAHLEAARHLGMFEYVATVEEQLSRYQIGCCHVSAIRWEVPNGHNGGFDHHRFESLEDLAYLARYRRMLPERWVSLELENCLDAQLEAVSYLNRLVEVA